MNRLATSIRRSAYLSFDRLGRSFAYQQRVSDQFVSKLVRKVQQSTGEEASANSYNNYFKAKERIDRKKVNITQNSKNQETEEAEDDKSQEQQAGKVNIEESKISNRRENKFGGRKDKETDQDKGMQESKDEDKPEKEKGIPRGQEINFEAIKIVSEKNKLIDSQYGVLRLPDFMKMSSLTNIYYLVNSSNVNYINRVLKSDKGGLLLFPLNIFEKNARTIFTAVKGQVFETYYGTKARPKDPFRNCQTPSEIFNLTRRIQAEISLKLKRIGVICSNDGDVCLKGEQHKIMNIDQVMRQRGKSETTGEHTSADSELAKKDDLSSAEKFYKRDNFLPMIDMLQTISGQFLQHEGIKLDVLKGAKIHCRPGVWPPTYERLYDFYRAYLEDRTHLIKELQGVLEIGTGTGVLSAILSKYVGKPEVIHTIEINPEAVKTADMNKSILNLDSKIKNTKGDIRILSEMNDEQLDGWLDFNKQQIITQDA